MHSLCRRLGKNAAPTLKFLTEVTFAGLATIRRSAIRGAEPSNDSYAQLLRRQGCALASSGSRDRPGLVSLVRISIAKLVDQLIRDDTATSGERPKSINCPGFLHGERLLRSCQRAPS